ncbi:putative Tic20 family protein [Microbacterium sp. ZKA21]|jgi:uncharacterized Tic20 family protein|uniref:DUF4870 domain-containing protein n=1 Tax=Microbacterium sp. ZKA21 TaxID=3381694 RepID=UPI003D249DED
MTDPHTPGAAPDPRATTPPYPPSAPAPPAPGYAQPAPGYARPAPGYAQPAPGYGYPAQNVGYPAPGYGYPAPLPSGRRYWALLFLFYIPWAGLLVAPIVAIAQLSSARRSPFPVVRENARWAANWALSYFLYFVCLLTLLIIIGVSTSRYGEPSGLIAIPGVLLIGIGIYCLVEMIIGTVRSDRVVHRPPLAIPFFRA